uniref:Putative salivary serpin n=1 Tax=Ixodes ricinus TaxID=34613 RepID=A0A0K8R721_IXORI
MASNLACPLFDFTLDLYKQLLVQTGSTANIFYSPFSIAAALSMTLAGARHHTAKQVEHVMHLEAGTVHKHFSDVLSKIDSYAPDVTLQVANRLYSDQSFSVLPAYTSLLEEFYKSTMKAVDFKNDPGASRLEINAWVQEATRSKIKDLLPEGSIDSDTVLVIVNAIYFKGLWSFQFNPRATSPEEFHVSKDGTKTVDMMYKQAKFRMSRCDEHKVSVLEIPYKGKRASMVILLPDEMDGLSDLEKSLTSSTFRKILDGLTRETLVDLRLPRFRLEQTTNLKDTLKEMGIHDLFSSSADLSGMSGNESLKVSAAIHKAFVEVNEEGTEAAAASAFAVNARCAVYGVSFTVDHPFLFVIRSHDPDIILFMGSVREV